MAIIGHNIIMDNLFFIFNNFIVSYSCVTITIENIFKIIKKHLSSGRKVFKFTIQQLSIPFIYSLVIFFCKNIESSIFIPLSANIYGYYNIYTGVQKKYAFLFQINLIQFIITQLILLIFKIFFSLVPLCMNLNYFMIVLIRILFLLFILQILITAN